MSTRSTICVHDEQDKFYIYRHCDGYPDGEHGVPAQLLQALPFAWELPRFEAMDFAAAIVRAWKQEGGGNVYFTQSHDHHGDTEYTYDVTFKAGNLHLQVQRVGWMNDKGNRTKETLFDGSQNDAVQHFAKEAAW